MIASELKEKLETLMRETGQGSSIIYILDDSTGDVFDVKNIVWDAVGDCFFIEVEINE